MNFSLVAQQLIKAARTSLEVGEKKFRQTCKGITSQIESDGLRRGPLSFWGRSVNLDEVTQSEIVDPQLIQLIGRIAGKSMSSDTPHAGLQHTYGYLFSVIKTPYGMKRDRWTETALETSLGVPSDTLGPEPGSGTLLTNATWLAGRIAFRRHKAQLSKLDNYLGCKTAPELVCTDFHKIRHQRILESIKPFDTSWQIQTDLVQISARQNQWLLIYSLRNHSRKTHQLITLFPVSNKNRAELVERTEHSRRMNIRLRFNAYLPRLSGKDIQGRCRLIEF